MGVTLEDLEIIEKDVFDKADHKYVHISDCIERQESVNNKFANNDKQIEFISRDFGIIKKLMWAIATATVGSLVTALFEFIV